MNNDPVLAPHLDWLETVATAGFAVGLHVRFTTPAQTFQTYPQAWIEEYARDSLVMRDPTVAWAFERQGRISWDELVPQDEAGVLARAAAHGMRHGLTVSLLRDGTRSLGGFARPDRPFTPDEAEGIEASLSALHDATAPSRPHGNAGPR